MLEKISGAIKTRLMKKSERGLYLQDIELKETDFSPGVHFKYVIDNKSRRVTILKSDDGKNTVSRRKIKNGLKPVVDIRDSKAIAALKSSDLIVVTFYKDKLIIEGLDKVNNQHEHEAPKGGQDCASNVRSFTGLREQYSTHKRIHIVMRLDEQKLVSGLDVGYSEQISWFDSVEGNKESRGKVIDLSSKLKKFAIPLVVVSFFCGAGLLDYAFKTQGFEFVKAYDFDTEACETYRHNIGDHVVCADITNYPMELVPKAPFMTGGSPCYLLSNSNRKKGSRYLDQPGATLIRRFIERIQYNDKCQVFVWENVSQILTAGDGMFKEEIYSELSDFELTSGVLCSADFGDPQKRERAFIIGSKIGKISLPKPTVTVYKTVQEAFEGISDNLPNQKDYSIPKPGTMERMKYVPQGGNVSNIPISMRPNSQHSVSYRRLEWNKPSVTIPNPRKAVILHPEENRILSIRECARLFSLPDTFIFKGKLASMQQQVANGVPFNMASAIAKKVKEAVAAYSMSTAGTAVL